VLRDKTKSWVRMVIKESIVDEDDDYDVVENESKRGFLAKNKKIMKLSKIICQLEGNLVGDGVGNKNIESKNKEDELPVKNKKKRKRKEDEDGSNNDILNEQTIDVAKKIKRGLKIVYDN
jgi:hypothetical protein